MAASANERKIIYLEVNASKAIEGSTQATRALQQLESTASSMDKTLARMEVGLAKVGSMMKAQLALVISEIVGWLTRMAHQSFEAASGLAELAEQVGTTAGFLQSMQAQAVQAGVKLENLETAMGKFSQKIGEASNGSKDMIDNLNRLGVKILDVQGNLRPTEQIMVEVARAITSIEDPAKRSAAAVDFFGKTGGKMLPMLQELAKGQNYLSDTAKKMGVVISDETIDKLDKLADRMERSNLEWRKFFAETITDAVDWGDRMAAQLDKVLDPDGSNKTAAGRAEKRAKLIAPFEDFFDWIGDKSSDLVANGARFAASFIESMATIPGAMKNLFINAMDGALEALESGLNRMSTGLANSWIGQKLGIGGGSVSLGRIGGGVPNSEYLNNRGIAIDTAGQAAYDAVRANAPKGANAQNRIIQRQAEADQRTLDAYAAGEIEYATGAGRGTRGSSRPGVSNPTPKESGKSEAEKQAEAITKLKNSLSSAVAEQDKMTEAARKGEVAFQEGEARAKSLEQAMGVYGGQLDATNPKVKALADDLYKLNLQLAQGKVAEKFAVATKELENQNVILEAQIRLMNEAPEIQARELAIIKAKQEAEKAGTAITAQDLETRRAAIETNERLKVQQEELKKSVELWTAPLKQALENIQTAAADAFFNMLDSGKLTFDELGKVFQQTIKRMIAELLALATIKPIINVLVNTVGGAIGLSGATINQLGGGSAGGFGGGLFGGLGGLGGGSSLGGGSMPSWLGFLNKPISGSTALPYGQFGPPAPGQGFGSWGESLTWGQGLGAAAGAGMGIYQLATSKSTGGTIGGIASLIGAGVSLIPGIGQIAGPIIGLLGGLLPGLFGDSKPEPPTMRGIGSLDFSGGGFRYAGSGYGGGNAIDLSPVGTSIQSLIKGSGANLAKIGGAYGIQQQTYSKGDFSNATVFVNGKQWGQSSDPAQQQKAMDTATAHIAHQMMLDNGSGISDIMRRGLAKYGQDNLNYAFNTQELGTAVSEIKAFEDAIKDFGKTTTQAAEALKGIDDQFKTLYDTADKYGLDKGALDKEKQRQRSQVGSDFAQGIARQLMDPQTRDLFDIGEERTNLLRNNSALMGVAGYLDQTAKIEELYARKRKDIIEQYASEATKAMEQAMKANIATLDNLINRLTPGGDLSNMDPTGQLAGLKSKYDAAAATANSTKSVDDIAKFSDIAGQYLEYSQNYNGGNLNYVADRDRVLAQAQALRTAVGGKAPATGAGPDAAGNAQFQQLMATVTELTKQIATDRAENAELRGLLERYVKGGR